MHGRRPTIEYLLRLRHGNGGSGVALTLWKRRVVDVKAPVAWFGNRILSVSLHPNNWYGGEFSYISFQLICHKCTVLGF